VAEAQACGVPLRPSGAAGGVAGPDSRMTAARRYIA
jgi:hypothetical protein